jgi:hypothetical protein
MGLYKEENWATSEFGTAQMSDKRLKKRLVMISNAFGNAPTSSIPQACGSWKAAKGAYRFFDNERVEDKKIMEIHISATEKRLKELPEQTTVLAIQDTTQIDFTNHPSTQGLGMLSDKEHHGLFYHPTLMITPEKVPLGIIDQQVWSRPEEHFGKRHDRKNRPIYEKESQKWLNSLEKTAQIQEKVPHLHIVNVGDREADVFDLFLQAHDLKLDILVRASWNRCVEHPEKYLWDHMEKVPVCGQVTITVPRKKGQPNREATLSIRYDKISLKPPKNRRKEKGIKPLALRIVWAHETDPPDKIEPISWMLITTLPVQSFEEALEKVQWYACRWQIEIFFKIVKTGCRIEDRQLKTADRIKRCLAVDAIIAWRVLFLTMVSRNIPDMPCDVLLELQEWQALYCFVNQTKNPPSNPPTLMEATRMIAKLGGFLGRKHDGHPGPMVIWRGLLRLNDITSLWILCRSP